MSYSRFKLAKVGSMVGDIILYTEFKENWQYFFSEATMTPDAPGDIDKMLQIKNHTRRRGPGAPARAVAGHSRYYARSSKSKGSARPGSPYVIHEQDPLNTGDRERRQFAILGADMDVLAYARAKAKFQLIVTGPNGWSTTIQKAGGALIAGTGGQAQPTP